MKNFLPLLLCLLIVCLTQAQIPTRFRAANRVSANGMFDAPGLAPEKILPRLNLTAIQQADKEEEGKGFPFKFGENIHVGVTPEDAGRWINMANVRVWKFKITSKGAYSLNLYFDQFELADNSELYVYNSEGSMVMGPITSKDNTPSNTFGTSIFKGESLVIELKEPLNTASKNVLRIARVTHGYKNLFAKLYGDSGDCNIDVLCPDGNGWSNERAGVAMVLLGNGTRLCSSSLLNNTNNDRTPYILTAFHCVDTNPRNQIIEPAERTAAEGWQFIFQYWSPSCNGPDGSTSLIFQQATWRAAWAASDFALLQLNNNTSSNFCNISFLGWSRSTTAASSAASIHHPAGDVMKISFDNNQVQRVDNNTIGAPGSRHWVVNWDKGVTEPGSSGSPLFDQNRRVIGQLSGGPSGCNRTDLRDGYGRIDASWEGGGSSGTRLKDWLDPSNSGATTTNTITPYINVAISGPNVVCAPGTGFTLQNVPAGAAVTWTASTNISSQANGNSITVNTSANTGQAWVEASFRRPCDLQTIVIRKTFWIGAAPVSSITGWPGFFCPGEVLYLTAQDGVNPAGTSYTWEVVGGTLLSGQNTLSVSIQVPYEALAGSVVRVKVKSVTSCGYSAYVQQNKAVASTCFSSMVAVYPNPASDELTVTLAEAPETRTVKEEAEVRLLNGQNSLIRKGETKAGKVTFRVADVPAGFYYLHVQTGQGVTRKHVQIWH